MKQFNNIFLVGTSHVAEESVKKVDSSFRQIDPDIVALELDENRLYGLKHKIPRPKNFELIKAIGMKGFIFYIFGEFIQKRIGKLVKLEPGSEMLAAVRLAEENKKALALIDRDISITLRRFSKRFGTGELVRIFADILLSPFKKSPFNVTLTKVPSDKIIKEVVALVKKRYPSLYGVLIHERDIIMAKKLHVLSLNNPGKKILAVVGAGHIEGILLYLEILSKSVPKI